VLSAKLVRAGLSDIRPENVFGGSALSATELLIPARGHASSRRRCLATFPQFERFSQPVR
jgi:hypothetical protein